MILTAEQRMVQDMLRDYSQQKLKPTAAHRDKTHEFPAQELKELAELGAFGMAIPVEWGGAGLDYISLVLALEEIAAGDGAISTIISVQNSLPCGITYAYSTEAQKQEYLTRFASGEWLGCFCLTEPHVGSDASAISCRAERDGDEWVINGTKQFITSGKHAQVALVLQLQIKPQAKRYLVLLVPTHTPVMWSQILKIKWDSMPQIRPQLFLKTAGFLRKICWVRKEKVTRLHFQIWKQAV